MASPHASSFICLPFSDHKEVVTAYTVYFSVCIGSALIGVLGAALFLAQVVRSAKEPGTSITQRRILMMLAISDLCADIGVIGRSTFWLIYWRPRHISQLTDFSGQLPAVIAGAIVEHWVFFWYLATYFWTFFFAVDVYNSKHNGQWRSYCSHFFTWFFSIVYVAGSAASLWTCPPYFSCLEDKFCIISHFMCSLGPILIFMAALPLFYISTWIQMKKNAQLPTGVTGPAAEIWRKEREMSKRKIFSIILVFYICWIVNVVDGLILVVAHATIRGSAAQSQSVFYRHIYDYKYIYGIWLIQAVVNPLQGLFNAIAYGGIWTSFWMWFRAKLKSREIPYVSSWSGEYINVDFRVGRGKILHAKRRPLPIKKE